MARQRGAIFMKLGRAPDTIVIFIMLMVKNLGTKIRFLREFIRYFARYFENFLKTTVY